MRDVRLPFLLPVLSLVLCAEAPQPLPAPIVRVRLHPDEAWVTRVGRVTLREGGTHRLRVGALPPGLRIEDVQVLAKGPAGTRLGDLSVSSEARTVTETPEYKALQQEREALRERRDGLEAQMEAAEQEMTFIKSLKASHDQELSSRMTYSTPNPGPVLELSKGLQGRLAALLAQQRKGRRDLEKLAKEEAALDQELAKRSGERLSAPSRVDVEVTSPAGAVEVELSYRTRAARWRPLYEARLSEDRSVLGLQLYASVTQQSGEDWEGVRLEISNARPGRSLALPQIGGALEVGWVQTRPYVASKASKGGLREMPQQQAMVQSNYMSNVAVDIPAASRSFTDAHDLTPGVSSGTSDGVPAAVIEEATGLAATFLVDGTKEVPSDGEPHRFKVMTRELKPDLLLYSAPRIESTAFLTARFGVPEGLPLFPGSAVVRYAGNQRLGEAALELPPAGQAFSLSFGPYKPVRVSFRRVDVKVEQAGGFSSDRIWTLREAVEIANDGGLDLPIEIQDRLLKSTSDQVKVTRLPDFTPGSTEDAQGTRTWKLQLPGKSKLNLQLPVAIRAPKEGFLTGADSLRLPN